MIALLAPVAIGLVALSLQIASMTFFMVSMYLAFAALFFAGLLVLVTSLQWTPWALEALWAWRDGSIGPWSGFGTRLVVFSVLVLLQAAAAGALLLLALQLPTDYPAGWP